MCAKKRFSRRQFITGAATVGVASIVGEHILAKQGIIEPQLNFLPKVLRPHNSSDYNYITVMFDSLRYDHIGFHGNNWIKTPNIDAFATQSQVFDKAYSGGFPTLLNRAELFTGRYMYTVMNWEDLPDDAVVMATMMGEAGYTTGLVFDTGHLKDNGFFLDRGFQSWDWIRGQEEDRFKAQPRHPQLPASPEKFRSVEVLEQYLRNMSGRTSEADYLVAQTLTRAITWLEQNKDHGPFYLHVDCFDPHEPWDPPQAYVDLYNPDYTGEKVIYPAYAPPDYMSQAELTHMRALYAAEISLVDAWYGHFLAELDRLGVAENTVVMLLADHGFMLGEHNAVGKAWSRNGYYEAYPLYQELIHVPLMVRVPGQGHRRLNALVQPADIMPTILDMAGATDPGTMHGKSLRMLLEGGNDMVRETAVSGRSLKLPLSSKNRISITDGEWVLHHGAAHASSHLYYLPTDSQQTNDLISGECTRARNLHNQLLTFLEDVDTPQTTITDWSQPPC